MSGLFAFGVGKCEGGREVVSTSGSCGEGNRTNLLGKLLLHQMKLCVSGAFFSACVVRRCTCVRSVQFCSFVEWCFMDRWCSVLFCLRCSKPSCIYLL